MPDSDLGTTEYSSSPLIFSLRGIGASHVVIVIVGEAAISGRERGRSLLLLSADLYVHVYGISISSFVLFINCKL